MADIELVVKIDESKLWSLKNEPIKENFNIYELASYIVNKGVVIPKGHGRLGDLDALETEMVNGIHAGNYEEGYEEYGHINNMDDCVECVKYADTIIEADVESEVVE